MGRNPEEHNTHMGRAWETPRRRKPKLMIKPGTKVSCCHLPVLIDNMLNISFKKISCSITLPFYDVIFSQVKRYVLYKMLLLAHSYKMRASSILIFKHCNTKENYLKIYAHKMYSSENRPAVWNCWLLQIASKVSLGKKQTLYFWTLVFSSRRKSHKQEMYKWEHG